ncbi:hypothetical protein Q5752_000429 [Cryptotrichosporon argae]
MRSCVTLTTLQCLSIDEIVKRPVRGWVDIPFDPDNPVYLTRLPPWQTQCYPTIGFYVALNASALVSAAEDGGALQAALDEVGRTSDRPIVLLETEYFDATLDSGQRDLRVRAAAAGLSDAALDVAISSVRAADAGPCAIVWNTELSGYHPPGEAESDLLQTLKALAKMRCQQSTRRPRARVGFRESVTSSAGHSRHESHDPPPYEPKHPQAPHPILTRREPRPGLFSRLRRAIRRARLRMALWARTD